MKILALMLAGAFGTVARYGFSVWIQQWVAGWGGRTILGSSFPLSTLIVNVVGTFLLAILVTFTLTESVKEEWRIIIGTGFLGAFTTFSTFEIESEQLMAGGEWRAAIVYIFGNLLFGLGAIFFGRFVATRVLAMLS